MNETETETEAISLEEFWAHLKSIGVVSMTQKPKKHQGKYYRWCRWAICYGAGPEHVYGRFRRLGRRRIRVLFKQAYRNSGYYPPI